MMIGATFGRLTVRELLPHGQVLCTCSCKGLGWSGGKRTNRKWVDNECLINVPRWRLTSGNTKSCGCLHSQQMREKPIALKYGLGIVDRYTKRSWDNMRARCNPNTDHPGHQKYYGHVEICERWWASVDDFVEDMGPRPRGTTLDRIDPWGNYEPGNCRWATPKEQAGNKRR